MPESYGLGVGGSAPGERLPWEQVERWLEASRNYWVCSTRPDGRPHAVPVWGLWLDGRVLFSRGEGTVTLRNVERSPEVVVHLESGDEVAILEGRLEPTRDRARLVRFVEAYERKYDHTMDPDDLPGPVLELRPRVAFAWREQDFPESATRWTF